MTTPRANDSCTIERVPSTEQQPGPFFAPHVVPGPVASPQLGMLALVSAIMQSLQPKLDLLESKIQSMGQSEESLMPSVQSLPPFDESNPWKSALRASCQHDMLMMEGL